MHSLDQLLITLKLDCGIETMTIHTICLHFPKNRLCVKGSTAQSITTMLGPIKWCVSKPSDLLHTVCKAKLGSSNDHIY